MRVRLINLRENISTSLWVTPTLLVLLASGLAALTLWIDEVEPGLGGLRPWFFGGSASAARSLLSTIAGSLITVVALAFSVTIVAIQQASTQFSPRVIRNFMRDRPNQVVFGTYIATFVYALLVLRQVRSDTGAGDEFIPAMSVTIGLLLALLCVGLLIFFIHHTAVSLQVSTIVDAIRRDLREGMERLYPTTIAEPASAAPCLPAAPATQTLRSVEAGFLRQIDAEGVLKALPIGVTAARVRPQVGDYVFEGAPLIDIWAEAPLAPAEADALVTSFPVGRERSLYQDFLFGIRQLVDIALKALSPGINDPTTAEQCLVHLGDTVAQLATRPFPAPWREHEETGTLLFLDRPDFAAIVEAAFGQIRREASGDVHVTTTLLDMLAVIATRIEEPARLGAIRHQAAEVLAALDGQSFTPGDHDALRGRAAEVLTLADRVMSQSVA